MCTWEAVQKSKLILWELLDYNSIQEICSNCRMCIPSIRRNLISVPILDRIAYSFLFRTRKVKLYQDSLLISTGLLCGGLYKLELSALPSVFATLTVNTVSSTKHLKLTEQSSIIWHKH